MASETRLAWRNIQDLTRNLALRIMSENPTLCLNADPIRVWGIPRGGGYVAAMLYGYQPKGKLAFWPTESPQHAHVAVDDILDSGRTAERVKKDYGLETYALVDRQRDADRWSNNWIVFPWEGADGKRDDGISVVTRMLQLIGEDAKRDGLKDTPRRVVDSWAELFEGYSYSKAELTAMLTRFPGPENDGSIELEGISFSSTCEHHLMPYRGVATIHYVPTGGVIGLSKFPRVVQLLAHRLTIQEQLTQDILDVLAPVVAKARVKIEATHSCLKDRGIRAHGVSAITRASI